MKTLLALPLLLATTGAALADTYSMDNTEYTTNIKVSISGGCKLQQTFANAQVGRILNETTNQHYYGALTSDNQLLLRFDDELAPQLDLKATQNLSSGKIVASQRWAQLSSLSDEAISQLLNMACAAAISYSNFYGARLIENKVFYRGKLANAGATPIATVSYNNKGTIETWVINPAKVVNSDTTTGNIRTLIMKQKADKTKIKISYGAKISL